MNTQFISHIVNNLWKIPLIRDFFRMIFFSFLSMLFGIVQFRIPGVEGVVSDLREIPMLISIFYYSNPLFTIGMSAITSFGTPSGVSYLSTFLMHTVALLVSWYFYHYLNRKTISTSSLGLIWLAYTCFYYAVLLIPVMIIGNYFVGLNEGVEFFGIYLGIMKELRYEIVSSSIISSLFLVQYHYRNALKRHLNDLEAIVNQRTKELNSTIEELKKTQQYLIQSEKMASLGTLSSGIAHEINNPLNYIAGGLYIIQDLREKLLQVQSGEDRKEYDTAIESIQTGLEKVQIIIDALMTFSSRAPSHITSTDLHEIIENTLLFLNHTKPEKLRIEKDYQLKDNIPLYSDKMHQVIFNLMENAFFEIKVQPEKKGLIRISTRQTTEMAILSISNSGGPISESDLKQLFDPFFTTKDPGKGVGLGLSIAYTLISDHQGTIRAENTKGAVRFIIELPLKQEPGS